MGKANVWVALVTILLGTVKNVVGKVESRWLLGIGCC